MKSKLVTHKIKQLEERDDDGRSSFKLAARGRQGLKSHVGREHVRGDVVIAKSLGSSKVIVRP